MLTMVVAVSSLIGGICHSVAGFGAGMIMLIFLPHFMDMLKAPALSTTAVMILLAYMAWEYRKDYDLQGLVPALAAYIPVNVVLLNAVKGMDLSLLSVMFGFFMILLAAYYAFGTGKIRVSGGTASMVACSVLSAAFSALFGIGGPTMALYFLSTTKSREAYLGKTQFFFLITGTVSLIVRILKGIYTKDLVPLTLVGFAGVMAGCMIGSRLHKKIDDRMFKAITYGMVAFSGLVTVVKNL